MVNSASSNSADGEAPSKILKKIVAKDKSLTVSNSKENELLLEKIKSVKVERLQKAINDKVTWSLLTQDVRDGVLAEYAKLLMK